MKSEKKVFISYSWSSPEHEEWVTNLVDNLIINSVEVIFDKADLKEGQDLNNFMESMVNSPDISKVLIILDSVYTTKANKKSGGVGTETQIISPEIYGNVIQEKFIPIVREIDENGNPYIPVFLKARKYIDFSIDSQFEDKFEQLMRTICGKPEYIKPKLGELPSYLVDEERTPYKTSLKYKNIESQINKNENRTNGIIDQFLNDFFEDLKTFEILVFSDNNIENGKIIIDNIKSFVSLRNEYIYFLEKILKNRYEFDFELFIKLFEKFPAFLIPSNPIVSWKDSNYDNFRYIFYELFLYTITLGIKFERYDFVEELLYSTYFLYYRNLATSQDKRFNDFYTQVHSFDDYYRDQFNQTFYNPMADLIIKSIPNNISKLDLFVADYVCYFVSELDNLDWIPITTIYYKGSEIEFISRLKSLKHFNKVKRLFNVNNIPEFLQKLNIYKRDKDNNRYPNQAYYYLKLPLLYQIIDKDSIGSLR